MSSQSSALASLTATYTDSEGEEDYACNDTRADMDLVTSSASSPERSPFSSRPSSPAPQVRVTSKVAHLVSYFDDTILSDEEAETESNITHEIIMLNPDADSSKYCVEQENCKDGTTQIPPEPPGNCSLELQEKILKLYNKMENRQLNMNAVIQDRKDFRNPSIYEKLIQYCGINELGTNYPPSIYDPLKWSKESFYEELAKVQKVEMDKREKERKSKVEFVTGTKKQDDDRKRKSKWDQPAGSGSAAQNPIKPAGLVQASLTSSATGTKSTVISAFGSLPKRNRI